ncbi:MAG TPA: hypothetical protein DE313_01170 [Ruminococcus sp.]|nr:hypothetical protein [Ruminococcus sp.]
MFSAGTVFPFESVAYVSSTTTVTSWVSLTVFVSLVDSEFSPQPDITTAEVAESTINEARAIVRMCFDFFAFPLCILPLLYILNIRPIGLQNHYSKVEYKNKAVSHKFHNNFTKH